MAKQRVVVIGAGFAGLSAANFLSRHKNLAETILINKSENSHFRSLIPDVISGRVNSRFLLYPLLHLRDKYGFTLFPEQVTGIDFSRNELTLMEHKVKYDYLIFAAGSQTVFPPNESFRHFALRLNTVHDANRIKDAAKCGKYERFVVCGGGYTGVELAANLQQLIQKSGMSEQVIIAEMAPDLAGSLPSWMRQYIKLKLSEMGIQIRLSSRVTEITEDSVILSNGEKINKALCIWTTGLEGSSLTRSLDLHKEMRGRIVVDQMLRFRENCFAAGDAACFKSGGSFLRMAVQYSLDQGRLAAKNVISHISGFPLDKFSPRDPGYVVPLAYGKGCGELFGIPVKGLTVMMIHYLLGVYRSRGIYNRIGIPIGIFRDQYSAIMLNR